MSHIFQRVDNILLEISKGMLNPCEWIATGTKQDFLNAMTIYKDDYEPFCMWEFSPSHSKKFSALISAGDANKAIKFAEKFGKRLNDEIAFKAEAMIMMQCLENYNFAQKFADDFYYFCLKSDFYNNHEEFINKLVRAESNKIVAKKPRNRTHSEAVAIAKLTRAKYPGASLGGMCKELFIHYEKENAKDKKNQKVSMDSLNRWLKQAGIRPISKKDSTSFTLVFPEGA